MPSDKSKLFYYLSGALTAVAIMPKPISDTQTKTQIKTVSVQTPAKIIYKDKVRQISVVCPTVSTQTKVQSVHTDTDKRLTLRLSVSQDLMKIRDVNSVKIGVGYFLTDWLSLDVQTNLRADTIFVGTSVYF